MLWPRIIPCLLIRGKGLVKTVAFGSPTYIGDPINAVRIFNEKGADEAIVLDIDASSHCREPDYSMIEKFATESRMPLCYGGGVRSVKQAKTIISLGVEKVAVSSAAIEDPFLISRICDEVGSQSVVAVLDVKRIGGDQYEVRTHNGLRAPKLDAIDVAVNFARCGVGEIVINSIDNDGSLKGYDLDIVSKVVTATNVPVTALGGAGSLEDIQELIRRFNVIGAAAGSLFVFKGKYRAVLINYPSVGERSQMIATALRPTDAV